MIKKQKRNRNIKEKETEIQERVNKNKELTVLNGKVRIGNNFCDLSSLC